ncbi:uncharacterized protein LOC144158581 isoform X1 [Haemaphysalis longicornis]
MSTDGACSQQTQAAVATGTRGTQCAPRLLISITSQTEQEFPVDDAQAGAPLKTHHATRAGGDIPGKPGCRTCSCRPPTGNERSFSTDSKKIQFGGILYSCLTCQQSNHQATKGNICTIQTPYSCTVCQKSYRHKRCLDMHMKVCNGERCHACGLCQKSFTRKSYLVAHERVHSGERPFVCRICQKSFSQKGNLDTHHLVRGLTFVASVRRASVGRVT